MHTTQTFALRTTVTALCACGLWTAVVAAEKGASEKQLPIVASEDFENGAERWQATDPEAWKVIDQDGNKVFNQFKQSKYKPAHRSPLNIALLKDVIVGDFVLTAKVQSTCRDYGHRDMCLFFGYQNPSRFYYVHLGKQTDDHANQIFIVNDAPRTKISTKTSSGTPWTDEWHNVKLVRRVSDGVIEVYYDDMKNPVMTAKDRSFVWGQIGLGSFDDTGNWDDVKLHGVVIKSEGS